MMWSDNFYNGLSILVILVGLSYSCIRISAESANVTAGGGANYFPGIATWYGNPTGAGSGGACGLGDDVALGPYNGFISAGSDKLFLGGRGCGACYRVKCTSNPSCSGSPIAVTITDQCPGNCDQNLFHFDLSGIAFGALAKPGQANNLRKAGRINIQFQRVRCNYRANVRFRIDSGSNDYYLAFVVENVNGYGDIGRVELLSSNPGASWLQMQRNWGVTWSGSVDKRKAPGPYSVRITSAENRTSITASNVIPVNWLPGKFYTSLVNFS